MKKFLILFGLVIALTGCSIKEANVTYGNSQPNRSNKPKVVKIADLTRQDLTALPKEVLDNSSLEEVDLAFNSLKSLPSEIGRLKSLKILKLNNNILTDLPAELGQLDKLEFLDLSNNQLTGLPLELGNLSNLKTLNLRGNKYAEADVLKIKAKLPKTVFILNYDWQEDKSVK